MRILSILNDKKCQFQLLKVLWLSCVIIYMYVAILTHASTITLQAAQLYSYNYFIANCMGYFSTVIFCDIRSFFQLLKYHILFLRISRGCVRGGVGDREPKAG